LFEFHHRSGRFRRGNISSIQGADRPKSSNSSPLQLDKGPVQLDGYGGSILEKLQRTLLAYFPVFHNLPAQSALFWLSLPCLLEKLLSRVWGRAAIAAFGRLSPQWPTTYHDEKNKSIYMVMLQPG